MKLIFYVLATMALLCVSVAAQTRPCTHAGEVWASGARTFRCDERLQWKLDGPIVGKSVAMMSERSLYERPKFFRPYGPGFVLSMGVALGGIATDIASSNNLPRGLHEANPLLRNSRGGVSASKALGLNMMFVGLSVIPERKNPKAMFWARVLGIGAIHFALTAHNYRLRQHY